MEKKINLIVKEGETNLRIDIFINNKKKTSVEPESKI